VCVVPQRCWRHSTIEWNVTNRPQLRYTRRRDEECESSAVLMHYRHTDDRWMCYNNKCISQLNINPAPDWLSFLLELQTPRLQCQCWFQASFAYVPLTGGQEQTSSSVLSHFNVTISDEESQNSTTAYCIAIDDMLRNINKDDSMICWERLKLYSVHVPLCTLHIHM